MSHWPLQVILSNSLAKMAESSVIDVISKDYTTTFTEIIAKHDTAAANTIGVVSKRLVTLLTSEMQLAVIKCDKGLFHLNKLDQKNNGPDIKKRAAKEAIEEFRYAKIMPPVVRIFLEFTFRN